ncbi:hypothetical protein PM082_000661 [Marasmius tenuissimus]|nr:hypothetical protein PM082_000661 [Marasmius tenuissimus]
MLIAGGNPWQYLLLTASGSSSSSSRLNCGRWRLRSDGRSRGFVFKAPTGVQQSEVLVFDGEMEGVNIEVKKGFHNAIVEERAVLEVMYGEGVKMVVRRRAPKDAARGSSSRLQAHSHHVQYSMAFPSVSSPIEPIMRAILVLISPKARQEPVL